MPAPDSGDRGHFTQRAQTFLAVAKFLQGKEASESKLISTTTNGLMLLVLLVVGVVNAIDCSGVCKSLDCGEAPASCDVVEATTGCRCGRRRLQTTNGTCALDGDPTKCGLEELEPSTIIETGGLCIFGEQYSFQVFKRDPKKIAIVFRGGSPLTSSAAVGTAFTTDATFTVTTTPFHIDESEEDLGLYDGDDSRNVFKEYTIISIPQCGGDLNFGNVTTTYVNGFITAHHRGAVNVAMVLDWLDVNTDDILTI